MNIYTGKGVVRWINLCAGVFALVMVVLAAEAIGSICGVR